jgi:F-type H+-transporting ATPase subunit epsilon
VLDGWAFFAVLPAHDGQIGIATNHAPLICKLGMGPLRVDTIEGKRHFFIEGGFARVRNNELVILSPTAIPAEQIDPDQAKQQLEQAKSLPLSDPTRTESLARAKTQVSLSSRQASAV